MCISINIDILDIIISYINPNNIKNVRKVSRKLNTQIANTVKLSMLVENLDRVSIPEYIKCIKLGQVYNYNYCKKITHVPNHITHIKFDNCFTQNINDLQDILSNVTHITFGNMFNTTVENLPSNLQVLRFAWDFNQCISHLPKGLKKVYFGERFNKPVDELPNSITHLTFGWDFDQSIDNLPNSLLFLDLSLCHDFDKELNNLPQKLERLILPYNFTKTLHSIPKSVKNILIYRYCIYENDIEIFNSIPTSVIDVTIIVDHLTDEMQLVSKNITHIKVHRNIIHDRDMEMLRKIYVSNLTIYVGLMTDRCIKRINKFTKYKVMSAEYGKKIVAKKLIFAQYECVFWI